MDYIRIGADPNNPISVFDTSENQGEKSRDILNTQVDLFSALSGDELAIDQFDATMYSTAYIRVAFIPKDSTGLITADGMRFMCLPDEVMLDQLKYGTPLWYYNDDNLIGKFYITSVRRASQVDFDVTAQSAIGILDGQTHYGGVYTGQTFETVARAIIGGGFASSYADDVKNIRVYGWLPIASRRSNLHQLMFAVGVAVTKDSTGEMRFVFPDTDTVKNVEDRRLFLGGSVDYQSPATKAAVTEHTYMAYDGDEVVTLYDNTESGAEMADHTLVTFQDAPIHDLVASGSIVINESGVNYAILTGVGTLTGKKYTHLTKVVESAITGPSTAEKVATVDAATLVSVVNSENVCKRVLSYYSSARAISSDLVLKDEHAGDLIAFNNPYGEAENAFLSSMQIRSGSFLRAACELISGYVPSGGGNNYTTSVLLTGSGMWASPITGKIRVALIGGGTGGGGGNHGGKASSYNARFVNSRGEIKIRYLGPDDTEWKEIRYDSGTEYTLERSDVAGVGGLPGEPGEGGKILILTMNVTKGQQIAFSCGVGGDGGEGSGTYTDEPTEPQAGAEGTATTFGNYTSANGQRHDYGYLDIMSQTNYATKGDAGISGGNGYLGGKTINDDGEGPNPGKHGGPLRFTFSKNDSYHWGWSAGCGTGGSAYGVPGTKGGVVATGDGENDNYYGNGIDEGSGVRGAKPLDAEATKVIGKGGQAGHGGGGGAGAGAHRAEHMSGSVNHYMLYVNGGSGGQGGKGGKGGPGGILIFM